MNWDDGRETTWRRPRTSSLFVEVSSIDPSVMIGGIKKPLADPWNLPLLYILVYNL